MVENSSFLPIGPHDTNMQPSTEFLTPEECADVDKALLTAREKFSTRVAIYALRSLKQIAQQSGVAIEQLQPYQVSNWVETDETLQDGNDPQFRRFFTQLVLSSLKPLHQAAEEAGVSIAALTVPQVIHWFEQESKARLQQQ